jgi:hypothetical protein
VVLDVLFELGDEFRGEGAPGLADGVHDVGRGRFFGAALEHDALEYMLRGPARGELDVGRGEQPRLSQAPARIIRPPSWPSTPALPGSTGSSRS